jgi:hypothetical protein
MTKADGLRPVRHTAIYALVLVCAVVVSSCSGEDGTSSGAPTRHTVVSRPVPGVRVGLAPMLDGGYAGWCVVKTRTSTSKKGSGGGGCGGTRTSTGPIFFETCDAITTPYVLANVRVLTRGDVAAVTVVGGSPIPTESNSTLPDGLRAAAIELPGYRVIAKPLAAPDPWSPCPLVTALDVNAKPIKEQGRPGIPLAFRLPTRYWEEPARPSSGVCRLTSTRLSREIVAYEGTVTTRLRPFPELLGQAFISCAETTYLYRNEHHLPAAVLLDAARPGTRPPGLPGMKPLPGHPSIFEAPPHRFARRIRGAWLVVQEEDNIGPSVPVELLERLRAFHFN